MSTGSSPRRCSTRSDPADVGERRLLPALVRQPSRDGQPVDHAGRLQPVQRDGARWIRGCPAAAATRSRGLYDVNRLVSQNNVISLASKFGTATEVFNGVDLTVNARLPQGHHRVGRPEHGAARKRNYCFAVDSPQGTGLPPAQGATSAAGLLYCDVKPPFQPNVKLLGVYPLPWQGVQLAATFQSLPGPQITASRTYTNAEIAPSLGRPLATGVAGTATVPLDSAGHDVRRAPVSARLPRIEDLPVRPAARCRRTWTSTTPGTPAPSCRSTRRTVRTGCGRPPSCRAGW